MATGGTSAPDTHEASEISDSNDAKTIQNIYFNFTGNIQNLQIGDGNEMVTKLKTEGLKLLRNKTEAKQKGICLEWIIVPMINSILNPSLNCSVEPTNLQKLETAFCNNYGRAKLSFKDLTGKKLLSFLKEKQTLYRVWQKDNNWMVLPKQVTPENENVDTSKNPFVLQSSDSSSEESGNEFPISRTTTPEDEHIKEQNQVTVDEDTNKAIKCNPKFKPQLTGEEEAFLKNMDHFKEGHYVLITSITSPSIHTSALALIPWLVVFDFDCNSRKNGLLSLLEDKIKKKRNLEICTMREKPKIAEKSTLWNFCMGYSFRQENSHQKSTFTSWYKQVRDGLISTINEISRFSESYTTLNVLVLWPTDDGIEQHIRKVVCELAGSVETLRNITLCISNDGLSKKSETALNVLCSDFKFVRLTELNLDDICMVISDTMDDQNISEKQYCLPTSDGRDIEIDRETAVWLHVDLDVLYKDTPPPYPEKNAETFEKDFLRGANLPWFIRYKCQSNSLDVERDKMKKMIDSIKRNYIDKYQSGTINLYHSPGSGGTTLAQRILFEMKGIIPCVEIRFQVTSHAEDILEKLVFLIEKTGMPVLAMIDGEDENRVQQLLDTLADVCHVIILYVKRFPDNMDTADRCDTFYLSGEVTKKEASQMCVRFKASTDDPCRKKALDDLKCSVERGFPHFIYEFGLTAYLQEFKGIVSFVQGYLRLNETKTKELQTWQNILGFLALVQYYGQMPIPIMFFSNMLSETPNSMVCFPKEVIQVLVRDFRDERENMVRVTHYIIAKEILNQLLGGSRRNMEECSSISLEAKTRLFEFAKKFIGETTKGRIKSTNSSSITSYIHSRIFISRDNKGFAGIDEDNFRKKPLLSRLLLDIPSDPPHTKRLEVLKMLIKAFPAEPNFQAHIGRFYAYFRPDEEEETEKHLKEALDLCNEKNKGKSIEEIDHGIRHTLMIIHNMFGQVYKMRIARYTGYHQGDKPEIKTESVKVVSRAHDLIRTAMLAIDQFKLSRKFTPLGQESTYGYFGEITVRLQVCDFIHRNNDSFICSSDRSKIETFPEENVAAIGDLASECCSLFDTIDHSFFNVMTWYTTLFQQRSSFSLSDVNLSQIQTRRLFIAKAKLKDSKGSCGGTLYDIKSTEVIERVVEAFEMNFVGDNMDNVRTLDLDYKEWILAIRHDKFNKNYDLEAVLSYVSKWRDTLSTHMSVFYLFVLQSLIGFGVNSQRANLPVLKEAQKTMEILKSYKTFKKARHPKEWLGKGQGIKGCLISGLHFNGQIDGRKLKMNMHRHCLPYLKGTICPPNSNIAGYIDIDLGEIYENVSAKAFFHPKQAKLDGGRFADTRVEFVLGFSMNHGYEAYNVAQLEKYECRRCDLKVEMKTDEEIAQCATCHSTVTKVRYQME